MTVLERWTQVKAHGWNNEKRKRLMHCPFNLVSSARGERGEEGRHTQGQYERHFCDCITLNNIHASVYQTHTFVLGGVNNITDANFIISLSRDVQQFTFCISDVCAFVVSLGQQVHL